MSYLFAFFSPNLDKGKKKKNALKSVSNETPQYIFDHLLIIFV